MQAYIKEKTTSKISSRSEYISSQSGKSMYDLVYIALNNACKKKKQRKSVGIIKELYNG